jgi:hypothetical protein
MAHLWLRGIPASAVSKLIHFFDGVYYRVVKTNSKRMPASFRRHPT